MLSFVNLDLLVGGFWVGGARNKTKSAKADSHVIPVPARVQGAFLLFDQKKNADIHKNIVHGDECQNNIFYNKRRSRQKGK